MLRKSDLIKHRAFRRPKDTGWDIVFNEGADNEIRWKLVDGHGETLLFPPIHTAFDTLAEAVKNARFILGGLNAKLDFEHPHL